MNRMKLKKVGAVLLAAGSSSRFGSNKLLFPLAGKPMVMGMLEKVEKIPFAERIVVTRYPQVEALAESRNIPWVRNNNPKLGISYSIRLGLERLADMDGWMFLVCDQPGLRTETIANLLTLWQNSSKGIAAVESGGVPGNPVIFSSAYRKQLEALQGDRGGKSILLSHMEDVLLMKAAAMELEDMDYFL